MNKKVSTNFKEVNLDQYLYGAVPLRFQDIDPSEFEDFIAHLFRQNGYELVQTSYSADFGADLIVKKEGVKTAVQVKRYFELHKVGISDINQVVGAQQYYRCDQALIVSTSSYTPAAKELADVAGVILWDWHRLEKVISDTFMDGHPHHDYYKAYPVPISATESELFKLEIKQIELPHHKAEGPSRIIMRLTNLSSVHQKISLDLPILLTEKQFQCSALKFSNESFSSGILYGEATAEIICQFSPRQFSDYDRRDRILLPIHLLESQEMLVLEQKLGQVKDECYLVTFYFGRNSSQYSEMIVFRDEILMITPIGRALIRYYYTFGSFLVKILSGRPRVEYILRPFILTLIKMAQRLAKNK